MHRLCGTRYSTAKSTTTMASWKSDVLGELLSHNAEAALLDEAARSEILPLQQSMAWARWYNRSRRLEE